MLAFTFITSHLVNTIVQKAMDKNINIVILVLNCLDKAVLFVIMIKFARSAKMGISGIIIIEDADTLVQMDELLISLINALLVQFKIVFLVILQIIALLVATNFTYKIINV